MKRVLLLCCVLATLLIARQSAAADATHIELQRVITLPTGGRQATWFIEAAGGVPAIALTHAHLVSFVAVPGDPGMTRATLTINVQDCESSVQIGLTYHWGLTCIYLPEAAK